MWVEPGRRGFGLGRDLLAAAEHEAVRRDCALMVAFTHQHQAPGFYARCGYQLVGRVDGYVVFVRGGVPGDRLRVKLYEARSRFGRAAIEAVEAPSPDRVEAPCPYFGRCGGCRLQHVAYPAQLAFKTKQVRDCLERLGGLGAFELRPILAAPEQIGRAHV